eukprot:403333020
MEQRDPINHVKDATDLEKKKNELDRLFTKLCNERAQDFNNILFSVRPLEHQLNELSSYVDGLQKSSKVLKDELLSQTNLFTFRQLEFKSLYYQELIEGLQVFEKIERMIEEVEFLSQQQNLIQASISFQNLKKFVFSNEPNVQLGIEVKSMLQEFGMLEMIKKRISEKQRILQDQINSNLLDLLFARSKESCSKKLQQIMKFFEAKFQKLDSNESILEYICQDFTDLKKIQDQFQKIHTKENDSASKAQSLIDQHLMTNDEAITMGLLCLQKDYEKAIQDQNVAYLVILINAYKRVSQDPIQEYLRNQLDNQIQGLVQRLIEVLSQNMKPQKKFYSYQQNSISDAISELLQIDCQNLKKVALLVQSIFLFFQQNLSFFMLIDKQEVTTIVESGISLDYVNIFFYYFKFLIQILFDHDRKIKEFNLKNGISEDIQPQQNLAKKLNVEKNMRFSFRNKEEMESFLVDSVRLKLDFYKTMEEMMVPILFKQNISFVMTLGSRMICMIDGVVDQVDLNFSKDSQNKQQIQAFKGWMKRFIVTNYEIFLDHYKQHCDFVAQKYFNKTFDAQNLVKIGIQDEKVLVGSSQKLSQSMMFGAEIKESMQFSRASIIGRINQSQIDHNSMWSVFEYIKSFSYVSQLAVERIPLEDKNKQDQAMFRQEILESVNKTMKKVYEKMIQVVNICFTGSHKDAFFSAQTYSNEKDSYFFKGLIKQEEVKSNSKQKASKDSIEEQEFLYKPKLAMQNELLSNSMSTLTLLMQIYHRMSDQAIKEFSACYQYISSQKLWEQLLSEKVKKDFNRNQESIQNINYDILVFLRCEFTTRAFSHLREMTIFYLFATLQKQVFRLYGHYVRFIKRQEIDEFGFQRLKKTLFQLKVEFDLIVPKMLGEGSQSNTKRFVDEMRQDIAREYEKTIYILQLIVCDEEEIEYKIQENDYGLTEQDFEALENIQKSYSSNMYSQNEEQQQIHDKDQKLDQIQ